MRTWVTTVAAARIMGISTGTVLKLIKSGEIKARRKKGRWPQAGYDVDFESVLDLVEKRRNTKRR